MTRNTQSYKRGVVYIVCAGLFLSTAGLLIRHIDSADAWTILFYRSIAFFITVTVFMRLSDPTPLLSRFRKICLLDLAMSLSLGLGFIFYVLSMFNTSVAMTVLLLSTGPFIAAMLGLVFLRESIGKTTWVSMLIALAGVAIMVSSGLESKQLYGAIYALLAVLAFAIMIVIVRASGADRDMLPATAVAGIIAAILCIPFLQTLNISMRDLLIALMLGSVQVGGGFILITLGARSVPAAQVPLLALGETALAPLWVWWIVNEVPTNKTLIGGILILLAVIVQGLAGWIATSHVVRHKTEPYQ